MKSHRLFFNSHPELLSLLIREANDKHVSPFNQLKSRFLLLNNEIIRQISFVEPPLFAKLLFTGCRLKGFSIE